MAKSVIKGLQAFRNERKTVGMDQALMNSSLSEKEWEKKTFSAFFLCELFQVPWLQPVWGGNLLSCCGHLTKGQFSMPWLADFNSHCREVGVPTLLEAWVGSIHMPALPLSFQAGKSVIEPSAAPIFCQLNYSLQLEHRPALQYKISLFQDTHLENISYQKVKFYCVQLLSLLNTWQTLNFSTVSSWN